MLLLAGPKLILAESALVMKGLVEGAFKGLPAWPPLTDEEEPADRRECAGELGGSGERSEVNRGVVSEEDWRGGASRKLAALGSGLGEPLNGACGERTTRSLEGHHQDMSPW